MKPDPGIGDLTQFAIQAVRRAGDVALKYYGKGDPFLKFDDKLVTEAELQLADFFRGELRTHYPEHGVFGDTLPTEDYVHGEIMLSDRRRATKQKSRGPGPSKGVTMPPVITILTDFGLQDSYVAAMKGVILTLCPEVHLVDISHLVPPQDIRAGAFLLAQVFRDFPRGTIHIAVVDPGVGTNRRGLMLRAGGYLFVGPDNGLFAGVVRTVAVEEARSLENPEFWRETVSATFHGRDVFAPVAAHLAMGVSSDSLGPICEPMIPPWSGPHPTKEGLAGEVIYVDHFGNVVTNITREDLQRLGEGFPTLTVQAGSLGAVRLCRTYGETRPGSPVALVGSGGHLEIAVNEGSAAREYHLRPGLPVRVCRGVPRADS